MIPAAWPAPAKLNLFLHVVGRRPDGYHELQTVFQLLDLADELEFSVRKDGQLRRTVGPPEVPAADDLAVRAARLLRDRTGTRHGVDIVVRKRIPLQGGLGGGSSDAATALVALNELWGTGLDEDRLAALGLELGADVPVFVRGHSAWAEGIGEQLTPLKLPPRWFAVIRPATAVATGGIFQAPELTRNSPRITIKGFLQSGGRNDCAPVVTSRHPEVQRVLEWLGQRGAARLTGTGSCVFAAFDRRDEAAAALTGLPSEWLGFVARGLDISPLVARRAGERAAHPG